MGLQIIGVEGAPNGLSKWLMASKHAFMLCYTLSRKYTEAKVDVTQEIEQRAQQAAQAGADHCALCSIS